MDQIGRIRVKNLLSNLLVYCDNAKTAEEKAALLRISIVVLSKLRIHASTVLGGDVRELLQNISSSEGKAPRDELLVFWDDTIDLLESYREAMG